MLLSGIFPSLAPTCVYTVAYWTEAALEKESLLQEVIDFLLLHKYFITVDQGWSDWDLKIYQGLWSTALIQVCTENHGGSKRLLRARCMLRMSRLAIVALGTCSLLTIVFIILGKSEVAVATGIIGVLSTAAIMYQNFCLGRTIYHVLKIVAKKLDLLPAYANDTKVAVVSAIGEA